MCVYIITVYINITRSIVEYFSTMKRKYFITAGVIAWIANNYDL